MEEEMMDSILPESFLKKIFLPERNIKRISSIK